MRVVVPRTLSRRGAGLGNELGPWAKAHLAAEALDARCLHPAWGLNPRRYWEHFGTSRWDVVVNRLVPRVLPSSLFDERAYRATGKEDFGEAVGEWARATGLLRQRHFAVEVEGMWGGFPAIRRARSFVLRQLEGTKHAERNLSELSPFLSSGKVRVGVHVRRGDFHPSPGGMGYRSKFNVALPLAWYRHVCGSMVDALGPDGVAFVLVSDGPSAELEELVREFAMATTHHQALADVSDLLVLARCDVVVCSISTYSMVAAWLGRGRYVWFRDQLQCRDGMLSIWGHEAAQVTGTTARNAEAVRLRDRRSMRPRGVPIGMSDPVPAWIGDRPADEDLSTDLIMYGCVPAGLLDAEDAVGG